MIIKTARQNICKQVNLYSSRGETKILNFRKIFAHSFESDIVNTRGGQVSGWVEEMFTLSLPMFRVSLFSSLRLKQRQRQQQQQQSSRTRRESLTNTSSGYRVVAAFQLSARFTFNVCELLESFLSMRERERESERERERESVGIPLCVVMPLFASRRCGVAAGQEIFILGRTIFFFFLCG